MYEILSDIPGMVGNELFGSWLYHSFTSRRALTALSEEQSEPNTLYRTVLRNII